MACVVDASAPLVIDPALVARVRAGDQPAAHALVAVLYPLVMKIARARRPRRVSEEDLSQMIFARIFSRLDQYSSSAPLEHWVSRIAVNTCLHEIAAEKARPELREADLSEEQLTLLTNLRSTTAELPDADRQAARELVGLLLEGVSPADRLLLTLLHLEERSLGEIHALTGWNPTLTKVRAFRARRKLKRQYERLLRATGHV